MPEPLPLLNVFEIEVDGRTRYLIGFIDTVLAGAAGLDERSIVGEYTPGPADEFDPASFQSNPAFVEAFIQYMNSEGSHSPELANQAQGYSNGWLYLVDPRSQTPSEAEPPASDLLGGFAVDSAGQIVPDSFRYNPQHLWFNPDNGASGVFSDRKFYDWLHAVEERSA